ncbi:MAG: hypothetical protein AB7D27_04675 [Desulfomicrobium sp.]
MSVTSKRVLNLRLTGTDPARRIRGNHFKTTLGVTMLPPFAILSGANQNHANSRFCYQMQDILLKKKEALSSKIMQIYLFSKKNNHSL